MIILFIEQTFSRYLFSVSNKRVKSVYSSLVYFQKYFRCVINEEKSSCRLSFND